MRAVILNCTLKQSPEPSNTEKLAEAVAAGLRERDVEVRTYRVVDYAIPPGVAIDLGDGDQWPMLHGELLNAEILVMASPTWLGHPSSVAQKVLERMDAMLSETDAEERPVAYNRVAGVVVTGNEDGAHHVISEIAGALGDIGPGPGPSFSETDHGHEWSTKTASSMAHNLYSVALALRKTPIPKPG
jgi:multimeric flavodoxin WrbA